MYDYITMSHSYHFIYPHLETTTEYNTHAKEHPFKSFTRQESPMTAQRIHFTTSLAAAPGLCMCVMAATTLMDGLMSVILHTYT